MWHPHDERAQVTFDSGLMQRLPQLVGHAPQPSPHLYRKALVFGDFGRSRQKKPRRPGQQQRVDDDSSENMTSTGKVPRRFGPAE